MSSDIYAKPDLSTKVRYSRKEQEDRAEWEQREVDIYESTDDFRDSYDHFQSQEGDALNKNENKTLHAKYDKLNHVYNDTKKNHTELQDELQDTKTNLTQLQSRYDELSKNHSQLQEEVKKLKEKIEGKRCPEGWTRFGCSCYFKSTESKTWSDSRTDCWYKGADLVMINSKEEQKFIRKLGGESWIGLEAKWSSGRYEWEWVDGSALTQTFLAEGYGKPSYGYNGVCCDSDGRWTQSYYSESKTFICEK